MKSCAMAVLTFLVLTAMCSVAAAQAAVEYGLGAGAAATTAAPARNLGNQLGGVWNSLDKAAKSGDSEILAPSAKSSTASRRSTASAPAKKKAASQAAPPAPPAYEDARHIEAGIAYDELVRRFGQPSMAFTTETGARTLSYAAHEGTVHVEVENDKVVKVAGPPQSAAAAQ
jgi:hypothetical protein